MQPLTAPFLPLMRGVCVCVLTVSGMVIDSGYEQPAQVPLFPPQILRTFPEVNPS